MSDDEVLRRAAHAVVRAIDYEASFYDAQSPVEDWALDALQAAVSGDITEATALLDRYENAEWEERRTYSFSEEWDDQCGNNTGRPTRDEAIAMKGDS